MDNSKERIEYGVLTVVSTLVFLYFLSLVTGVGLTDGNAYCTYALQADSWRQGRLDLGQDYVWLELAIFEGKYYCSFPPFPSYVLFPLTFLFGHETPDVLVLWLVDLLAAIYLYRIGLRLKLPARQAMCQAFFVLFGSNLVFVLFDPAVWFFAQAMCFSLSVGAIYYALCGKGAVSLCLWACSVGCRPMQALFLPVLLILLYQNVKQKEPECVWHLRILRRWYWALPAVTVAISYMVLNYLRFGNVLEFGHNYLPEFIRAEHGQFHLHYVKDNLKSLLNFPDFTEEGKWIFDSFGNLNLFIVSPILIVAVLGFLYALWKRSFEAAALNGLILLLSVAYMFVVVMHKTMGAWHFGNRYANDILPWCYLGVCVVVSKYPRLAKYQIPFALWGICINVLGTVVVYNWLV